MVRKKSCGYSLIRNRSLKRELINREQWLPMFFLVIKKIVQHVNEVRLEISNKVLFNRLSQKQRWSAQQ